MRQHFQGKKTKKELTALFSTYEVRNEKSCEIPASMCNEDGRSNQTENQNKDDIQIQIAGATCKENDQSNQIENRKKMKYKY